MSTATPDADLSSPLRTPAEEAEAAITHGFGAAAALVAGVYLIKAASEYGDFWTCAGCAFYVFALCGVLVSSALSHLLLPVELNRRFRAFDQGFIYLLASASLWPFVLAYLRSSVWMPFFVITTILAARCFLQKVVFFRKVDKISLKSYLTVGWSQAIALIPLARVLPAEAFAWILSGAACYLVGLIFFVLDNRRLKFHTIWHLFVLAACVCHFYAILRFTVMI